MTLDPNIEETSYCAYFAACYFSADAGLAIDDQEVEGTCIGLGDWLGNLQIEEREVVHVPEIFQVPSSQIAPVECEKMLVRTDSIIFSAIPRHASFYVQTVEIPITVLEAALAISPSTTQA